MLEIFSDFSKIKGYKIYRKYKKIYSYTNKKWVYYHDFINTFNKVSTLHKPSLPWEFLEHHTEDEIRNYFDEDSYKFLSRITSWIEDSKGFKKMK